MSQVMLLVSREGATLGETRVDGDRPEADEDARAKLREEARVSGFTEADIAGASFLMAGDPPNQP